MLYKLLINKYALRNSQYIIRRLRWKKMDGRLRRVTAGQVDRNVISECQRDSITRNRLRTG